VAISLANLSEGTNAYIFIFDAYFAIYFLRSSVLKSFGYGIL
jgi:hypothetical protein